MRCSTCVPAVATIGNSPWAEPCTSKNSDVIATSPSGNRGLGHHDQSVVHQHRSCSAVATLFHSRNGGAAALQFCQGGAAARHCFSDVFLTIPAGHHSSLRSNAVAGFRISPERRGTTSFPDAVVVSIAAPSPLKTLRPMPRSVRVWTVLTGWRRSRPSRSSFESRSVLP